MPRPPYVLSLQTSFQAMRHLAPEHNSSAAQKNERLIASNRLITFLGSLKTVMKCVARASRIVDMSVRRPPLEKHFDVKASTITRNDAKMHHMELCARA